MASPFDHLLSGTVGEAHAWSLPNVKGDGRERWIAARDGERLTKFSKKRDEQGRGVFFCVSTIQTGLARKKENALELPWLFVDVDFKDHDMEPAAIELVLRDGLECPPTRMHHTGNGIHCFWLMEEPFFADDMDLAEVLLRRLANHLGADPMVAHRVALLRVPGTHNTKRGERHLVRVIKEGREVYTPARIDAWLGSVSDPALVRRNRETNPFLRIAGEQAFRAPVDVDQRLADMRAGGEGDAGIHATQLSCTASLMAHDCTEEEAVRIVLEATQALQGVGDWDWGEEERNIRKMCRDYERKYGEGAASPQSGTTQSVIQNTTPRDISEAMRPLVQEKADPSASRTAPKPVDNVVVLADARKEREPKETRLKKQKNEHVVIGLGILASLAEEGRQIMYAGNQCWMYRDGLWKAMGLDEERAWASVMVEHGCASLKLVSTTKIVNETRAWLQRQPTLHKEDVDWDGHDLIATKSGMVDWRVSALLRPPSADDYCTRRIDCTYDVDAACPDWLEMLTTDYGFDEGTVEFLQEFAGTCLITKKPRGLMRALVLLGPSNTGKSNILNVISGLVSEQQNPTPLAALESTHGLMSFLHPNPWVLHEAFEQSRWEMSANAKALLSGDTVHVNVKNGPMIPVKFVQPIMWGTNVPPQFREASRAMENRLSIVRMHRAFDPMNVVGTAKKAMDMGYRNPAELVLDRERAGILNWAIDGLFFAMERGRFEFTTDMQTSLHAMRTDANMATGFIEECCEYSAVNYVQTSDFYGAFCVWHRDHRGGQTPSVDQLGRAMGALADPRVLVTRINDKRSYAGLKLNEEGLDCWNAHSSSVQAERSGMRISENADAVNRLIGEYQVARLDFQAMMQAHRTWLPT